MSWKSAQTTLNHWFSRSDWKPFSYQKEAWRSYRQGASGLVHAPTGTGKTLAVWGGPLLEWLAENPSPDKWPGENEPIRVLWITPLRALATDTTESLRMPVKDLQLPWSVEKRTSDTTPSIKSRQKKRLPTGLVTTPESLSLLLSYPKSRQMFSTLRCVIVDEWHELLSTKRGTQTELCLARLRAWLPGLRVWGLSATLGNIEEALETLVPSQSGKLIQGKRGKETLLQTLIPPNIERFPWFGHLGIKQLRPVIKAIERARSTLFFTNTRSQAEQWFRAILAEKPEWEGRIALHHGSLDREFRRLVEDRLRSGGLLAVVCTSSLDLGVDFSPVDQVIQLGSPKGIARLLQRAGRSGHQPGARSRILCVPTNAFELVEFAAARKAAAKRAVESRRPLRAPLDVLVQHLVTAALGGGFRGEEMLTEVRGTKSYRELSAEDWSWALDFVTRGGKALEAYPDYTRVQERNGRYRALTEKTGRMHRMNIGTITSDASVEIKSGNGAMLGRVEESFLAKLKPGDRFLFSGKVLQLVRIRDATARVRTVKAETSAVPRWMGGRMPLSTLLAEAVQERLGEALQSRYEGPEMQAGRALLETQKTLSQLPSQSDILIEQIQTRQGLHLFVYTFAGRLAHEGLSALVAWRLARKTPRTVSTMATDYGFEILSNSRVDLAEQDWRELLSPKNLEAELLECLNAAEMSRRKFREIARVAGLVMQSYPGNRKSARQLLTSSNLLFDVFQQFDPENRLLRQARQEALDTQLDGERLRRTLDEIQHKTLILETPERLTPMAFPLWAERIRQNVSSEDFARRIQDMIGKLDKNSIYTDPEHAAL